MLLAGKQTIVSATFPKVCEQGKVYKREVTQVLCLGKEPGLRGCFATYTYIYIYTSCMHCEHVTAEARLISTNTSSNTTATMNNY